MRRDDAYVAQKVRRRNALGDGGGVDGCRDPLVNLYRLTLRYAPEEFAWCLRTGLRVLVFRREVIEEVLRWYLVLSRYLSGSKHVSNYGLNLCRIILQHIGDIVKIKCAVVARVFYAKQINTFFLESTELNGTVVVITR